jgi:hypothetical protein
MSLKKKTRRESQRVSSSTSIIYVQNRRYGPNDIRKL